ncbi:MAG: MarR family transcriptional regulator [Lysobacterales bacterium CG17_big_fil_post_rev_8_21_14_2_50_64_11]|nr:MAG: MarR family transcriptional regulator [Xanthomonadales bacterium CG17_big_fil_post_rev_8_21_14_2_50_64_11]PIX59347.1 MAG: MarR family transcriptional regulator [Xanthomonadales bacterium CG_4_10_14_3_um_filter_64_11]
MNTVPLLIERLGALIQQSVREDAARHGLLPIHVQMLQYLAQANRYSDLPIAIAEYLGISRGTVSQSLAVLASRGLLTKQPDARHRKRLHLRLTAAGDAVLQTSWAEQVGQALQALPGDGRVQQAALRNLLRALQRVNGQRAFGVCRHCAHFCHDESGARCGLTQEPLAQEQITRICREWSEPAAA